MLKLPKGLKKKKKGKKSKRKGEDELFTEAELDKYRKEHQQQQAETGESSVKENEEWSKFNDLTTGVDSVLKKTQGDLDRIKSTSFFQRVAPKEVKKPKEEPKRPAVEITEADFPALRKIVTEDVDDEDKSEYGVTDDESEEEEQDDIFDTSYVEAVERGEVKLAYVPDSPEEAADDDIFDTSHVDVLIKGQDAKSSKGKKVLDIGVAVEVLTGRIDNITLPTTKRPKRIIPGDLLFESNGEIPPAAVAPVTEKVEASILDLDADIPITTPIDLSVSLHTSLIQQNKTTSQENITEFIEKEGGEKLSDEEVDEFTLLATETREINAAVIKLEENEIKPVIQESWSAFEANKSKSVFADGIVEDQIDVIDPYIDEDDPFDTSFADAVVPTSQISQVKKEAVILEDDDDFDPRAVEVQIKLNNRRKSNVRIHLTDPSGLRESITSDDLGDKLEIEEFSRDLLGGSATDLTALVDSPLNPVELIDGEIDPFDTTIADKIVAPGKVELKLLEEELIGGVPITSPIYRVPSDPDFDPRAEEPPKGERRASRPENLIVNKSVVFNVENSANLNPKGKSNKPVTPYYTRDLSITEDPNEESDTFTDTLTRTRSDEDLAQKSILLKKRRHSEYPNPSNVNITVKTKDLLQSEHSDFEVKVLTPTGPSAAAEEKYIDPFDTSFASDIAPCKTELKLLAKEFSCEDSQLINSEEKPDLLEPSDDIFQAKALTPVSHPLTQPLEEDLDPFDTSFANDLNPGKTELKLLESELLN